jgi:hypothetical protein
MPENGASKQDVAQIATAATAAIAVVASLAVTGVLARAEQNHPFYLFGGVLAILLGAFLWLVAALVPATFKISVPPVQFFFRRLPRNWKVARPPAERRVSPAPILRVVASLLFLGGLIAAIWGVLETQRDAQRPTVSVSFDATKNVLKATVSADGLRTDQRMALRVDVLKQAGTTHNLKVAKPEALPLYFALLGPDADGKLKYDFSVYVPPKKNIVGVEAWTADQKPPCLDRVKPVRQSKEAGCVIVQLKHLREANPPQTTTGGQ